MQRNVEIFPTAMCSFLLFTELIVEYDLCKRWKQLFSVLQQKMGNSKFLLSNEFQAQTGKD
ncbi:hypothetical protein T4D_6374 [Trichinella pseudospiralis]|uniref:Uncharacterized protein n=1 Tax=Trichinella pseudospiralis TaxID=6337 RepID=A0A0V1FC71_TRIPS|nr:hypothetical protein T4D_6374 [Trichinella pseudospiralis]